MKLGNTHSQLCYKTGCATGGYALNSRDAGSGRIKILLAARRRASRDSGQLADALLRPMLNRHVPRQAKRMLLANLIELTGLDWLAGLAGLLDYLGNCKKVFEASLKLAIALTDDLKASNCREQDALAQPKHPRSFVCAFRRTSAERERHNASSSGSNQNYMCMSLAERRARAKLWWDQTEAPFRSN